VSDADRQLLRSWIRAGTVPQRVVRRAQIVLLAAEGASVREIAGRLNLNPRTAMLWRRRYSHGGPEALWRDAPGRGRRRRVDMGAETRIRELLATEPPDGGRWSVRKLAAATRLSRAAVHRLLRACDLSLETRSRRRANRPASFSGRSDQARLPL
jgi:transposase